MRASPVYVIRRSDGTKWYIDAKSHAGTATSNRNGRAKRFTGVHGLWKAWAFVMHCAIPTNWTVKRLVRRIR
jgi:hypothetical protein